MEDIKRISKRKSGEIDPQQFSSNDGSFQDHSQLKEGSTDSEVMETGADIVGNNDVERRPKKRSRESLAGQDDSNHLSAPDGDVQGGSIPQAKRIKNDVPSPSSSMSDSPPPPPSTPPYVNLQDPSIGITPVVNVPETKKVGKLRKQVEMLNAGAAEMESSKDVMVKKKRADSDEDKKKKKGRKMRILQGKNSDEMNEEESTTSEEEAAGVAKENIKPRASSEKVEDQNIPAPAPVRKVLTFGDFSSSKIGSPFAVATLPSSSTPDWLSKRSTSPPGETKKKPLSFDDFANLSSPFAAATAEIQRTASSTPDWLKKGSSIFAPSSSSSPFAPKAKAPTFDDFKSVSSPFAIASTSTARPLIGSKSPELVSQQFDDEEETNAPFAGEKHNGNTVDEESNEKFKTEVFKAHVSELATKEVTTGEESEWTVAQCSCKIRELVGLEWPERGKGTLKLLQNKTTKHYRIVMRADLTYRLILNFALFPEFQYEVTTQDKGIKFSCIDGDSRQLKTYFALLAAGKDRKEKTNENLVRKLRRTMRIVKGEASEADKAEERSEVRV